MLRLPRSRIRRDAFLVGVAALVAGAARQPRPHRAAAATRDLAASRRLCAAGRAGATPRCCSPASPRSPRSPASAPPGSSPPIEFPGRDALLWLLPLPLAIPTYIVAYVYVDMLDALGPGAVGVARAVRLAHRPPTTGFRTIRSLGGAIFVMGFVLYPYVYLAARAMFQTQSAALIEAARTLGASRWRLARDITLPLARPAIAVGLALALLETLNDIGASEYLGVQTLTLSIFTTWLNRGSLPGAAQIACVMLVVVAALIALERYGRRRQRFIGVDAGAAHRRRASRSPAARAWLARAACLAAGRCSASWFRSAISLREVIVRGLLIGFDPSLMRHTAHHRRARRRPRPRSCSCSASARPSRCGWCAQPFVAACVIDRRPRLCGARHRAGARPAVAAGRDRRGDQLADAQRSPASASAWCWRARAPRWSSPMSMRFLAIATGFAQAGLARISTEFDDVARTARRRPARRGAQRSICRCCGRRCGARRCWCSSIA